MLFPFSMDEARPYAWIFLLVPEQPSVSPSFSDIGHAETTQIFCEGTRVAQMAGFLLQFARHKDFHCHLLLQLRKTRLRTSWRRCGNAVVREIEIEIIVAVESRLEAA